MLKHENVSMGSGFQMVLPGPSLLQGELSLRLATAATALQLVTVLPGPVVYTSN